jgi:pyruvate/2-oxoglutarate dehydrogenase complex dihydrolipoamide dehydrogenase (E3) component
MSSTEQYDVVVVGSGEAGKYLAWTLSKEGHRTALIERKLVGGSCPNVACLPSKNVIHSAKVASLTARAAAFGVRTGAITINMPGVQHRKGRMVEDLVKVHFGDENIQVVLNGVVLRVEGRSGEHTRVHVQTSKGTQVIEATDILVAAGRTPNTDGIGLELAGVKLDARGFALVNERLETTAPNVWAVGDCAGSPQFTHVAFDDFRVVHDTLKGGSRTTRDRLVPFCVFTDPELARVGLNESEARARGVSYRVASIPMSAVLRTRTLSEPRGFMKMLIETGSDHILGFTVFGAEASELMATVQTAMLGKLPFTVLRDALFTHPTAAEGLTVLLANVATTYVAYATVTAAPPRSLLVSRKNRVDALNESVELHHVVPEKLFGLLVGDDAILGDQAGLELNVRLDGVHLRRVAEREDAAQVLLRDRRADLSR